MHYLRIAIGWIIIYFNKFMRRRVVKAMHRDVLHVKLEVVVVVVVGVLT